MSEESLAHILDTIYKLTYTIGSSPEEVEELRLLLADEDRTYASRIMYQK